MALISKYDYVTDYENESFVILNENSNIVFDDITVENITPIFNISNGTTNIINLNSDSELSNSITINNSNNYIDNLDFNNNTLKYVEKGSIFNYANEITYTENWVIKSTSAELIIPSSIEICKSSKTEYIKYHPEIFNQNTGNEYYSTHYLTNSVYGYWGNKYRGEFIKDVEITANGLYDANNILNSIPRNLNGYTVTINIDGNASDNIIDLNIINFCNGILNINFNVTVLNSNIILPPSTILNIQNNNAQININFRKQIEELQFNIQDNEDLNFIFNTIKKCNFAGTNNIIKINSIVDIDLNTNLFITNSFSNKIYINNNSNILTEILKDNNAYNGNYFFISGLTTKVGDLVNDYYTLNRNYDEQFVINEVQPLNRNYREITDIGTIIGWNANLPIPRGYYPCSGQTISVDIHNPNDEFYNGMLAYYLNRNLMDSTFQLPNIPILTRTINSEYDPNYGNIKETIDNSQSKLIYIIKYNNNFQNVREEPDSSTSTPVTIPTNLPTTANANITFNPNTTLNTLTQDTWWGNSEMFPQTIGYGCPTGYINGENSVGANTTASGMIEWVIDRVPEECDGVYNGYYQLSGLRACIWSHNVLNTWSAQSWLYLDFTSAKIHCKDGKLEGIDNLVLHYSGHHNNNGGDGTYAGNWHGENAIKSLTFKPNISTEQTILERVAEINGQPVRCTGKFTITIQEEKIIFKALETAWCQGYYNNKSYVQIWHSPLAEAGANFVISKS